MPFASTEFQCLIYMVPNKVGFSSSTFSTQAASCPLSKAPGGKEVRRVPAEEGGEEGSCRAPGLQF